MGEGDARPEALPRSSCSSELLGEPSSRAYVVAGRSSTGSAEKLVVRGWYSGQSLESLTKGLSLTELERSWQTSLDRLKVGEDVRQVARARFDQPAIFGEDAPVVDRLGGDAGSAGQPTPPARALSRSSRLDPTTSAPTRSGHLRAT
jgi:hypothetical protein